MPEYNYEVFLSYARVDNKSPVNAQGEGWVTAFKSELERRHKALTGNDLRVFLDHDAIDLGDDWQQRLGRGLRQSRLFLAFLSPAYIHSKNCLWEWDQYLLREHTAARGDDGIVPMFFVTRDDLRPRDTLSPEQQASVAGWMRDLDRRNQTLTVDLQPWYQRGPQLLLELDAAERAGELKQAPRDPAADLRPLAERMGALSRHIGRRLERLRLADLAPGNIGRSLERFVGRHAELIRLHRSVQEGRAGLITATHSPGGLGKTALAWQYAHAYAEFFVAGGTWILRCEGVGHPGTALRQLSESAAYRQISEEVGQPLVLTERERENDDAAAEAILEHLSRVTQLRAERVRSEMLARDPELWRDGDLAPISPDPISHLPISHIKALLILDNVNRPELLPRTTRSRWW
jgi:hypothetical protein